MVKRKKTKEQTMIYKTLHRKLKIQQHEAIKTGVNSGAPEGLSVPAPNVVNIGKLMYIYLCSWQINVRICSKTHIQVCKWQSTSNTYKPIILANLANVLVQLKN